MIWRSRSLSARSASSIALSMPGSSGRASVVVITKTIESYSTTTCDPFDGSHDVFRSACCGRYSRPPRLMDPAPIEPLQQCLKLRRAEPHHAVVYRRPPELAVLKPLGDEHHATPVPEDQLYPVSPFRAEHVNHPGERIDAHRLTHQRRQTLGTLAEVDRFRRHHHPDVPGRSDHALAFSARITAATVLASAPRSTRTVTSPIFSLMPPSPPRRPRLRSRFGRDGIGADTGSMSTGANCSGPGSAGADARASRRHEK